MGAPSTTKLPVSSSARADYPRSTSPLTPYSEPASSYSKPGPSSSSSSSSKQVHTRRHAGFHHHHNYAHAHTHGYSHSHFPRPIIYTPHELFAISPDWSETVRARLQLLSSPEVLARSPLEEQPPASPSSGYLLSGAANTKKRRRSHCIHDLPVHSRRIIEEDDVDHTPRRAAMDGIEMEDHDDGDGDDDGKGMSMMVEEEDDEDERGRSRSRRSSMASFRTRRSERSLSRRGSTTKSRRQSEGQRDRAALMAILSATPLETPS